MRSVGPKVRGNYMKSCCTECWQSGFHSQRCGRNQSKSMRDKLRIHNFDQFLAHLTRDYCQDRCPEGKNYNISPGVMEQMLSQSSEVKQALSQTGNLGAVRNINAILMTRLREVTLALEGDTQGKGEGRRRPTAPDQPAAA
eukprot:14297098-Heterocapsa_arctica.AAC.1